MTPAPATSLPRILAAGLAAWVAAAGPPPESAGPPPTPKELARRADWVIHGRVSELTAAADTLGRIYTRVELESVEFWKGAATPRFRLMVAGGVLGRRKVTYTGQPDYALGEEVVVFAVRGPEGEAVTLDMGFGKFSVTAGTHGPVAIGGGSGARVWRLEELRKTIALP